MTTRVPKKTSSSQGRRSGKSPDTNNRVIRQKEHHSVPQEAHQAGQKTGQKYDKKNDKKTPSKTSNTISRDQARKLLIRAQGLHNNTSTLSCDLLAKQKLGENRNPTPGQASTQIAPQAPSQPTNPATTQRQSTQLNKTLRNMGVLQIDAINTIIRSHYMPLFSRLGNYDTKQLDKLIFDPAQQTRSKRKYFEYWGHECSVMPLDHFQLLQWRMHDAQRGLGVYKQLYQLIKKKPAFIKALKKRIETDGPLTSRSLEGGKRGPGMWEWSENKQALEYLFWSGEVTTRGRKGFERLYDLTENSIPATTLNVTTPDRETAQAELMERSIRALGVATLPDARDYYRLSATDAAKALQRLIEENRVQAVEIEANEKPAYCTTNSLKSLNTEIDCQANTLVTPFDPLVWDRKRLFKLFDFDYRIEIYVPKAKRRYGYYVLPYLLGNRIVARLDLKAERELGYLHVLGAWPEENINQDDILPSLAIALSKLAAWLGLESIKFKRKGALSPGLKKLLS